jgi:hypothetical protein
MTLRAIMAEVARNVIRVCRLLELRLMTLVAIRVGQLIVAIGVARLALCCRMSPRQREPRRAVIEGSARPVRR